MMKSEAACQEINRQQGDKDDPSSALLCNHSESKSVCVHVCAHVHVCTLCRRVGVGWGEGLTFNLYAHKSCCEHHLRHQASNLLVTAFSPLRCRSITPSAEILKINRLPLFRRSLGFFVLISGVLWMRNVPVCDLFWPLDAAME